MYVESRPNKDVICELGTLLDEIIIFTVLIFPWSEISHVNDYVLYFKSTTLP
jgi:hypothetical protein